MTYADEIRRQAEAAPRAALPAVASALWKAFGEGHLSEAEAEALSGLIEARTLLPQMGEKSRSSVLRSAPEPASTNAGGSGIADAPMGVARGRRGSRPRTDASMARRRRWAASGRLPPDLAARFTLAEQAVLSLVAAETSRRGDCRLAVGHLAAIVGVCRSTVKNAIREARKLGLLTVEERPVTGFRNLPNVVRIVSAEWQAWMRLARKGSPQISGHPPLAQGGGVKSATRTHTDVLDLVDSGPRNRRKGCRQAAGDLDGRAAPGIRAGRVGGRAMR